MMGRRSVNGSGRRAFLGAAVIGVVGGSATMAFGQGLRPEPTFPLPETGLRGPNEVRDQLIISDRANRRLTMNNPHTGERMETLYYTTVDSYLPDQLLALNAFCRDWRADVVFPMDPQLFDILSAVQRRASLGTIEMLSGYRTPETNEMLAEDNVDVAGNSQHIVGQAIDFTIVGVPLESLRDWALDAGAGGLGYYPDSGFIHVDTGPRRDWEA